VVVRVTDWRSEGDEWWVWLWKMSRRNQASSLVVGCTVVLEDIITGGHRVKDKVSLFILFPITTCESIVVSKFLFNRARTNLKNYVLL
jgi:hypothetical protein